MAANEDTNIYTNFSNVEIGTASGGGKLKVGGVQQNLGLITDISADTTLTAADSGKIYILDTPGEAIILPAVTNVGCNFKFIVGANIATTNWTVTSAEGDNMEGSMMVASTVVDVDAADVLTFVNTADNIGDWASVVSDGTYWYVDGRALTTGAITATG